MRIKINEEYRIITDQYQYILQRATNAESDRWLPFAYYTSLTGAVNGLLERDLKSSDVETLEGALARLKQLHAEIISALLPEYRVLPEMIYKKLVKTEGMTVGEFKPA